MQSVMYAIMKVPYASWVKEIKIQYGCRVIRLCNQMVTSEIRE